MKLTMGKRFIDTVIDEVLLQAPLFPVTVYVVEPAGVAVTCDPVVELKFVLGDHVYVTASEPPTVRVAGVPAQEVTLEEAITVGKGFMVITIAEVPMHPLASVPLTE